jgi:hypothetical protein
MRVCGKKTHSYQCNAIPLLEDWVWETYKKVLNVGCVELGACLGKKSSEGRGKTAVVENPRRWNVEDYEAAAGVGSGK